MRIDPLASLTQTAIPRALCIPLLPSGEMQLERLHLFVLLFQMLALVVADRLENFESIRQLSMLANL